MAKAELTWEKSNVGKRDSPSIRSSDLNHRSSIQVTPSNPNYIASLNTGQTEEDLAIAVLCGAENSGFCINFEGRWNSASP
jgi:hypothetical protein